MHTTSPIQLMSSMIQVREILVILLAFLASQFSFWYPINSNASHPFHLSCVLGFFYGVEYYTFQISLGIASYKQHKDGLFQLEIYGNQWKQILDDSENQLSKKNAKYTAKMFDLEGLILMITTISSVLGTETAAPMLTIS